MPKLAASAQIAEMAAEIAGKIHIVRGQRVLIDSDLAAVYGVKTHRLNEQIRQNASRFPGDLLLRLTIQELAALRSQFAILKSGRGQHRKYPPLAFTEHGAVMAATILNGPRAVEMSVYVVRAVVELRAALITNAQLTGKLDALEKTVVILDADSWNAAPQQFRLQHLVAIIAIIGQNQVEVVPCPVPPFNLICRACPLRPRLTSHGRAAGCLPLVSARGRQRAFV